MNEHESAAMWKLYLKSNEGIAVQTTFQNFRGSITDNEEVYIGAVKYVDYETDTFDDNNFFTPLLHKRKSFEHEREVRAIVNLPMRWKNDEVVPPGIYVNVNLELLVQKIYVAPSAPIWLSELVSAVVRRYGYGFEVRHSTLDQQPMF